jgi:hypothetical protein
MMQPESPALAIAQGIHDLLTGDSDLMGLINGVFDYVPEDVDKPYVTVDESEETPDNAHGQFGSTTVQVIRIWTRNRGHREGLLIEARLRQLLDHRPGSLNPLVNGHRVIAVRFTRRGALIDPRPPGDIRHIPLRYTIVTEQEAP